MVLYCFFFNDTATTEIYTYLHTLSLHDALPIYTIKVMARDNVLHPQQKQFFQMALPEIFEGLTHSIADSEETIPGKEVARIAALEMREVRALCDAGILADRKSTRLNSSH